MTSKLTFTCKNLKYLCAQFEWYFSQSKPWCIHQLLSKIYLNTGLILTKLHSIQCHRGQKSNRVQQAFPLSLCLPFALLSAGWSLLLMEQRGGGGGREALKHGGTTWGLSTRRCRWGVFVNGDVWTANTLPECLFYYNPPPRPQN